MTVELDGDGLVLDIQTGVVGAHRVCGQDDDEAILSAGKDLIRLVRTDKVGSDTGIYLRTDSVYDLHRRLIDEGVIFVLDPKRTNLGLTTSFKDDDGNIINAIEVK